jgi:hypothetical protein
MLNAPANDTGTETGDLFVVHFSFNVGCRVVTASAFFFFFFFFFFLISNSHMLS